MKIFKFSLIICFGLLLLLCSNNLIAQDISEKNSEIEEITVPEETPEAEVEKSATESDIAKERLNTEIQQKIKDRDDAYQKAREYYNQGEYDKGTKEAQKVKAIKSQLDQLKTQLADIIQKEKEKLAKKADAEKKIIEAKTLISKAENLEADKWAPDDLTSAKSSLLTAENSLEQKVYNDALSSATEAVTYAQNCLTKIEEEKKKQEESALQQDIKTASQGIAKGKYMIKTSYTVRLIPERRDCLWRIAEYKFIYNNPWKWPIIYKINKKAIGGNPDLIFPGQKFDIPALDEQGNPILADQTTKNEPKSSTTKDVPANDSAK